MERGSVFLIEPVSGIERQELDLGSFGQFGRLVDDKSPGLHSSLQCHAITVAPAETEDKRGTLMPVVFGEGRRLTARKSLPWRYPNA